MVLQTCEVKFLNPSVVFTGGDIVSGTINITLTKQKKLLDLTFQAKGETRCRWSVTRKTGKNTETVQYSSSDVHFREVASLLTGYERDGSTVVLEPGNHTFGFSFQIPQGAPTAMEGQFGRVRYTLKVTASRSMRFDDVFKHAITVISKYDLNMNPRCAVPMKIELYKKFHLLLASRGNAFVCVHLPMSGFVPGQTMQMFCELKNDSHVKINGVHFSLMQKKTFTCTHPRTAQKEILDKIVKHHGEGVDEESETSYAVALLIPSLPPSTIQPGLITTEYFLRVKVVVSGMHSNVKQETPISIGTIPIGFNQANYNNVDTMLPPLSNQAPESVMPAPSAPPPEPLYSGNPPPYHELAPPTYEESQTSCMMAHPNPNGKDMPFSPVYPVFNIPPLQYPHQIGFIVPKE